MNKPFTFTSTTNPWALVPYAFQGMLGVDMIFGAANTSKFMSGQTVLVLGLLLFMAGTGSLVAGLIAPRLVQPRPALLVEMVGSLMIALVYLAIEVLLAAYLGFWHTPITETFTLTFIIGGAARAAQIIYEHYRWRKAMAAHVPADKPLLADPSDRIH